MSRAPNNPFDTAPQQPPPQKSSNTWLWVLGTVAGVFLLSGVICCGAIWYGAQRVTGVMADAAAEEFKDDPVVVEHIGGNITSEMNIREGLEASAPDEGVTTMVFQLRGDKGSGKIFYRTNANDGTATAKLVMENGDEHELQIPDEFDGVEDELDGIEQMEAELDAQDERIDPIPQLELNPQIELDPPADSSPQAEQESETTAAESTQL
ncbi:hypothetical protein NHH03_26745 [Stieleria sp. TO1_6]|uniref:hypothetical protein n=1 Tax=Stieleria tagensis TaxID=2956795 RepID=UPI00209A8F39|nr:hypothetical protein [Stieleria tagensis]MCO8125366.1 hypothetical protein [Stieleria tagensis]